MAKRSRLESLPVELLDEICGYLLPSHDLLSDGFTKIRSIPFEFDRSQYNHSGPANIRPHLPGPSLLRLRSTSQHLRSIVDSFSASQLRLWKDRIDFHAPGYKTQSESRIGPDHTARLIRWTRNYCVWCGVPSKDSRAWFANGLACCFECNEPTAVEGLSIVTLTPFYEIIEEKYGLTDTHLFNYTSRPSHWPVIRFAMARSIYFGHESGEIIFEQSDVEKLAVAVHGDWRLYVRRRNADRVAARKAKEILLQLERIHEEDCPYVTHGGGCSCVDDDEDSWGSDLDDEYASEENDSDENDNDGNDKNNSDGDDNQRGKCREILTTMRTKTGK